MSGESDTLGGAREAVKVMTGRQSAGPMNGRSDAMGGERVATHTRGRALRSRGFPAYSAGLDGPHRIPGRNSCRS